MTTDTPSRKRGRPRKIPLEVKEVQQEELDITPEIPIKPKDTRISKSLVPIKFDEKQHELNRMAQIIFPHSARTIINQEILMVDWFVNTMDSLDKSGLFDSDGGWRKKFNVDKALIKYEAEIDDNI